MDHPVHALQRVLRRRHVADVPLHEADAVGHRRGLCPVDLLLDAVEDDHLVTVGQEPGDEVGTDEAEASGDECAHCRPFPPGRAAARGARVPGNANGYIP